MNDKACPSKYPKKGDEIRPAEVAAAAVFHQWQMMAATIRKTLEVTANYVAVAVNDPCENPKACAMPGSCGVVAGHGPLSLALFKALDKHGRKLVKALELVATGPNSIGFLAALIKSGELPEPVDRERETMKVGSFSGTLEDLVNMMGRPKGKRQE